MRTAVFFLSILLLLLAAGPVPAEEAPKKALSDEAELSFVDTSGNTDTTTFAFRNTLKYRFTEAVLGTWKLGALYGKEKGVKSAERYGTELRLDYLFTERVYTFAYGGWFKDPFAGIDARYYGGIGAGYKFLTGPVHTLAGELGLTYTSEEYTDGTDEGYLGGRAFAEYRYAITEKNRFTQSVEFLYDFDDSDNYQGNSETAVVATLTDLFSLKASYVVRYSNRPVPATLDDTDTTLSMALLFTY